MSQYTIIANAAKAVLHIELHDQASSRLLVTLLSGNPTATRVPRAIAVTEEFKKRLQLLDVIGERSYLAKQFFNEIPTGQHILFLPGHIDDSLQIYVHTLEIANMDGVPHKSIDLSKIAPYLYDHYEVHTFSGDERLNIGVFDKSKRICRFCGRSMPEAKFKQKAHAISEALGNKGLICREECDDCNARFNQTIEQDITRINQFFLVLKGVKGKNGSPTIQGDGISVTNDSSSRKTLGRDTLVFKVKDWPNTHDPQIILKYLSRMFAGFSNIKYTPQNIYKCMCKYVLSVIDSKHLSHFKNTIDWINEPPSTHRLPIVWYYSAPINTTSPYLVVMLRKHKNKEIPFCWAILNVAGHQYLFILPFCSLDKYKFVGKKRMEFFMVGIRNTMPNISFHPMNLSSKVPTLFKVTGNFNISPDCVEGRDYYFVDSR